MREYAVGIDLGGTRIKIGLVNDKVIIKSTIIPAQSSNGLAANLSCIEDTVDSLLAAQNIKVDDLKGIAIGFPGLVNHLTKKILSTNKKYDDAISIDLEKWAKDKWNIPLIIENDARAAAVGEWKYGAAKGYENIVTITIGTGIGTAAIIEGKLLRGSHFQAGCLGGHISLQYNGRKCTCGNIGCAEAYGSTWSLQEIVKNSAGFETSILKDFKTIDFEVLFESIEIDLLAAKVLDDCISVWAAAIVNLIHAYDPEVVIIGGGVLKSADKILPRLTERIHALAWCPWGKVQIKASALLNDAGILGASYFLSDPL